MFLKRSINTYIQQLNDVTCMSRKKIQDDVFFATEIRNGNVNMGRMPIHKYDDWKLNLVANSRVKQVNKPAKEGIRRYPAIRGYPSIKIFRGNSIKIKLRPDSWKYYEGFLQVTFS